MLLDADEVVPGDILFIQEGDKIPADGVIISAARLTGRNGVYRIDCLHTNAATDLFHGTLVSTSMGNLYVRAIDHFRYRRGMKRFSTERRCVVGHVRGRHSLKGTEG